MGPTAQFPTEMWGPLPCMKGWNLKACPSSPSGTGPPFFQNLPCNALKALHSQKGLEMENKSFI